MFNKTLKNYSKEFKLIFLLEFTKRLIISSSPEIYLRIKEEQIKTKQEKFKEAIKSKIPGLKKQINRIENPVQRNIIKTFVHQRQPVLRVPETRLPPQFQYLRPTATKKINLDLGKLNPLLNDSGVKIIEANGPDQQVIVRGRMGTKPTNIILTKDEINKILQIFSEKSKIPIEEGATKIVLGRFILSAIISKEAGSRFILQKIPINPPNLIIPRK